MEKHKPFKLFVPPRFSSSQVSAVKPQTSAGDANFFKVNLRRSLNLTVLHFQKQSKRHLVYLNTFSLGGVAFELGLALVGWARGGGCSS
jgi:hypothetical protein